MEKRVIALDPGGTTGVAAVVYDVPIDVQEQEFTTLHIGPHEHHADLWNKLYLFRPTKIVCESFEFRQNKQRDNINLMSKEYIGLVKTFSAITNTPVVFQTAAIGKGFVSDEKLKAMGLWVPGKKHAMDAMRHLITYLVQKERRIELIESWRNL